MKQKFSIAMSLAVILAMLLTAMALASSVDESIVDATAPTGNVTLNPGGSGNITINLSVTGRQENPASFQVYRTWTLSGGSFTGSNPQTFNVAPRAAGDPATTFSTSGTITVSSGQAAGTFTLAVGAFNIVTSAPAALAAGGSSNYQVTVEIPTPSDTAAPNITCTPPSDTIWYGSNVTVPCTALDSESGLLNSSDANFSLVTSVASGSDNATASTSTHQVCDKANNCAVAGPYTFMVDMKAPTISAAATTSPNLAGWYKGDVTIHFTCSDSGSGIPTGACPADEVLSTEGTGVSSTAQTVTDAVGNISAASNLVSVNIDKTAPGITFDGPSTSTWYNADVTANWSCTDAVSGPVSTSVTATTSGEGLSQSATGTCTDNAGNTASDIQSFQVDKTVPTITAAVSAGTRGSNGWYTSNVTVHFTCADSLSGVVSCPADEVLSTEGTGISSTAQTATDAAGNTSAASNVVSVNIDKTAPSVSLVGGPANGASYYFGSVPAAPTCSASDATSGLDGSCSVSGYSAAVGSHTVTASSKDMAGNSASATATYEVKAWTLSGFYAPVDMGIHNLVKGGATVPLKFEIFAGSTELTDTSKIQTFTQRVSCTAGTGDDIEQYSTGGTSLRYDTTSGQFIFNWQSLKGAGVCYRITVTTQDGSSISADFTTK